MNIPNPRVFLDIAIGGRNAGRMIFEDIEKPLLEKDISINKNSDFNELRNMYKYNKHF
ncbi:hypothetical protein PFMALIP_03567 [Plasmodium falciparum MaliPS096_E11]|uniref:Uncharacterized protein n=1 Tax=Plasmodium falciparum MaliPS096_E11 TaxID=1036727 RepID=A0A024WN15_PLAFA|nr:hypothetical protein PFMALIP_03567 [Plasmodium falciparum MaliPS096_E11]